jgi:hypothetical protein
VAESASMESIGRAGALTAAGRAPVRDAGAACSVSEPHAEHSGQRPTHLATEAPHSVQRWAGRSGRRRAAGRGELTCRTLAAGTDRAGQRQAGHPRGEPGAASAGRSR